MNELIAVTGAAGFLGRNLIASLKQADRAYVASDLKPLTEFGSAGVDLTDAAGLDRWLLECSPTTIIHMGARTDLVGKHITDYGANTVGVSNLIATARKLPRLKRVIFASSRMVCRIDDVPQSYDHYSPPNAYGESKVEGEKIVKSSTLPFEWVLVRPTSIWGPGFGIPYRNFFDQVRRRRYVHQRGHNPLKSFGYVENTVFQLLKLIDAPTVSVNRKTFYLGDYQPLAVREWADYIHEAFELSGKIRELPMMALRTAAVSGDLLNSVMRADKAPLTSFRLNNLITNMVYPQLADLEVITGPLPFDWRLGTQKTVAWLKSNT